MSTRATNPSAIGTVSQSHRSPTVRLNTKVTEHNSKTPPATVRAAFSLTGFGNPMIFRPASFDASTPTDIVCLPCRNSCHDIAYCRLHAGGVICEDDHQPRRIRETSFLLGFHRRKVAAEMTDHVTCVSLDTVNESGLAPA